MNFLRNLFSSREESSDNEVPQSTPPPYSEYSPSDQYSTYDEPSEEQQQQLRELRRQMDSEMGRPASDEEFEEYVTGMVRLAETFHDVYQNANAEKSFNEAKYLDLNNIDYDHVPPAAGGRTRRRKFIGGKKKKTSRKSRKGTKRRRRSSNKN